MSIKENFALLNRKIEQACEKSNRDPREINLVAVAKTFPARIIEDAIDCGILIIGENRVQEAKEKYAVIGDKVEWHMVGHLQTNKVKDAIKIFSLIHSLDSVKLAREIEKRTDKPVSCLVEVNTSEETTKYGIVPDKVFEFFAEIENIKNIDIKGFMTIGPGWAIDDPEASRSCFRMLRTIRDDVGKKYNRTLPVLSMGMTSDFEIAIEEGSTMIRVGTALFGQRN